MTEKTIIVDDRVRVELQEGMHLTLVKNAEWTPYMAFAQAWVSSILLNGKPVSLCGIVPNVTLHIATRLQMHPGLNGYIAAAWPSVCEQIRGWLQIDSPIDCLPLTVPYSDALIAQSDFDMPYAAAHIVWEFVPGTPIQPLA